MTLEPATHVRIEPISPADSVPASMRSLNNLFDKLGSHKSIEDLESGDVLRGIDMLNWAASWEGVRQFRDQMILTLARVTREAVRRDINSIRASAPAGSQDRMIVKAVHDRARVVFGFAFHLLTPRHACLLADSLELVLSGALPPGCDSKAEICSAAAASPGATKQLLDAVAAGVSGERPIPPSSEINGAVTSAVEQMGLLMDKVAIDAMLAGSLPPAFDATAWEANWSGCRIYRDQTVIHLVRMTVITLRQDFRHVHQTQPEFNRERMLRKALDHRLRVIYAFAFSCLEARHICLLSDVLVLVLEGLLGSLSEATNEMASSAARAPFHTPALLDAVVLGGSGMFRYQPERLIRHQKAST